MDVLTYETYDETFDKNNKYPPHHARICHTGFPSFLDEYETRRAYFLSELYDHFGGSLNLVHASKHPYHRDRFHLTISDCRGRYGVDHGLYGYPFKKVLTDFYHIAVYHPF